MSESSPPPKTDAAPADPDALSTNTAATTRAVHFNKWEPLGGPVTLTLSPRRTVLVGRNGSGKSLLLEGIYGAADSHVNSSLREGYPPDCTWDICMNDGKLLHYQYQFELRNSDDREKPEPVRSWAEKCWVDKDNIPLWSSSDGILLLKSGEYVSIALDQSPLSLQNLPQKIPTLSSYHRFLRKYFSGYTRLTSWPARVSFQRKDVFSSMDQSLSLGLDSYLEVTVRELYLIWSNAPDLFQEIDDVGQRIGLWKKMEIDIYKGSKKSDKNSIAAILIDGVNLGHVSDGTLRMLEFLIVLMDSRATAHSKIMIDEPETGIHPGLLAKLLAEFDAYGADRQLVIATHSPQVVSWAKPSELRLVERVEGRTVVQPLSDEQAARVHGYLQDEGSLGEFVYGGGIDP